MNKIKSASDRKRPAIVAYTDQAAFSPLRLLKRRFRHCLILVEVSPYWIAIDSLIGRISYAVLDPQGLAEYLIVLHDLGYRCQVTMTRPVSVSRFRPLPLTCVEVAKRTLGIDDPRIWTPYQLYRLLKRTN
ncbi:MAG: hypothetical protein R8L07_02970 [Alphaproteobacteria bacterium]|nr:hypothetical protein [Alphaproteobacteria bacterium]